MAVSELLWNCFLLMLFLVLYEFRSLVAFLCCCHPFVLICCYPTDCNNCVYLSHLHAIPRTCFVHLRHILLGIGKGLLKAALSFYWPSIGEWRYDDLHPSLQYHESCRVKQLAVNGVFFIVYPCVLCYRCYASIRWTLWTECSETEDFAQYVEYSREEQELLRDGMIRGRMIVQREIVLTAAREDELSCYRKYDDCVVAVEKEPLEERTNPSECEPLNLSKDGEGLNNEEMLLLEHPREDATKRNTTVSSSEEEGDGDEISLIPQPSKACDASSFAQTGANR